MDDRERSEASEREVRDIKKEVMGFQGTGVGRI